MSHVGAECQFLSSPVYDPSIYSTSHDPPLPLRSPPIMASPMHTSSSLPLSCATDAIWTIFPQGYNFRKIQHVNLWYSIFSYRCWYIASFRRTPQSMTGRPSEITSQVISELSSIFYNHHFWILQPFHALDWSCDSSSWLSQIPSFRQETCQAY